MTSTDDPIESMRVHRRFTLVGGGGLRGDSDGMWTTYRHLQERVAAERARIRREFEAALQEGYIRQAVPGSGWEYLYKLSDLRNHLDRICPKD